MYPYIFPDSYDDQNNDFGQVIRDGSDANDGNDAAIEDVTLSETDFGQVVENEADTNDGSDAAVEDATPSGTAVLDIPPTSLPAPSDRV